MEHDDLEEALVDVPEGEDGGDDLPLAAEDEPETDSDNADGNRNVDDDENDDQESEDKNDKSQKGDSRDVTTKNDPSHTTTSLIAAISKSTTGPTTNKKKKGEEARRSTEEFDLIRTTNEYGDEIIRVQALIKTRARDKIWEFFHDYINPDEPSKRYKAQCIFCHTICKGEPRRLKHHLLNKCPNCPQDIYKKVGQTTEVERALKQHNAPAWVYEYLHGINDNVLKRLDSFKSSLSAQITAYENQINLQFDMANQRITNLERHLLPDSTTTSNRGVTDPYWGDDHDQNEFQNSMTMEFSRSRGGRTTFSTRKRRTRGGGGDTTDNNQNQNKVVVVKKVVTL